MSFPEGYSDEHLLLAMCVYRDDLQDPVAWCSSLRELTGAMHAGPMSSAESEAIARRFAKLREECNRERLG